MRHGPLDLLADPAAHLHVLGPIVTHPLQHLRVHIVRERLRGNEMTLIRRRRAAQAVQNGACEDTVAAVHIVVGVAAQGCAGQHHLPLCRGDGIGEDSSHRRFNVWLAIRTLACCQTFAAGIEQHQTPRRCGLCDFV